MFYFPPSALVDSRVLIVGANGQLSRELLRTAPEGATVMSLSRAELDISDGDAVLRTVREYAPSVVVNAAGYTAVDRAEDEALVAHAVNGAGAGFLAEAAARVGAKLVQVSTDFVFDGRQSRPYDPGDAVNPLSVYGVSKLAGERAVSEVFGERALILRTAWVYSAHGNNFVKTMLRLMGERESLGVVADQVGTPTWARDLASAVWNMIGRDLANTHHWTDAGVASWYDFAVAIQEEALALRLLGRPITIHPIKTADYPTRAKRPSYSVLDKKKTWEALGYEAEHWRVGLRRMLGELVSEAEVSQDVV